MTSSGRPLVMGVLNVTPDSFSDGGQWFEPAQAVRHGVELVAAGADMLDVGGESTRPGAQRIDETEELRRVVPVVRDLSALGHSVSVDTMRAPVARAAVEAGAVLVNDVSGGRADDHMLPVVAGLDVPLVLMHWRGHSERMYSKASYQDVAGEVLGELRERAQLALRAGFSPENLVLDPGFGFAKKASHNWLLLADLARVVQEARRWGSRVLVGTSRKTFLGRIRPGTRGAHEDPTPPQERDVATAATSLLAAQAGVWAVRVHQVSATLDALAVWEATMGASAQGGGHEGSRVAGSRGGQASVGPR